MEIIIAIKQVYGRDMIYPRCEKAHKFCKMLNQKTLTQRDLANIQGLGFSIKLEAQTVESLTAPTLAKA